MFPPADRDPSFPDADPNATSASDDLYFPNEYHVPNGATLPLAHAGGKAAAGPPPPQPALPVTHGRYRLDAEIARGAMGAVYRGRDTTFGREVAVKLLLDTHLGKPELRRRFTEEARITALLQHPGVVPVYEVGEFPEGRPFYVMRLMNGQTLAALLTARGDVRDDRSRFLKVFEKVCETLAFAHSQGVIHRDLKPANVMVGEFGQVEVMDWGVAKAMAYSPLAPETDSHEPPAATDRAGGQTLFGRVLGTPAYMSPEQAAAADRLDERTDVFGLGCLLCVILTGEPPYSGANSRAVYQKAVRADLADAFARLSRSGANPELVALAKRCLAPDPADRPRDAGALARELTDYLGYDLRRAERDLVRFFELSPDLFCIAGLDGYFRRVNANFSRVLGYPAEELLSRPFVDFVHPDDQRATLAELADLASGWPCVQFRNRYRDARGEYRWFEWMAKPIPDEGIVFAVARDVTDRMRLENQIHYFSQD
jgi:serine/threonine-protein kinase